jgi:hypothetical protein
MEAGAQRHISILANDWFQKVESGQIQPDPKANEKLNKLINRCQSGNGKPGNFTEELALSVKNAKQGGTIELCVMAMLTETPISVLQQGSTDQSSQDDGTMRIVYTTPKIDEATGKVIDGHYESMEGTTANSGPNDCLYDSIMRKTPGQFKSVDDLRTQCAAFILSTKMKSAVKMPST